MRKTSKGKKICNRKLGKEEMQLVYNMKKKWSTSLVIKEI